MSLPRGFHDRIIFDPQCLGDGWSAPSFAAHRAFVRGATGLPLDAEQRAMWDLMAGGRLPCKTLPPLVAVIKSRRVAGTRLAVAMNVASAMHDWPRAPGEVPVGLLFSPDKDATRTAYGYAEGSMRASPLLAAEVANTTADRIDLRNGNAMLIRAADTAALRGFSPFGVTGDEVCYVPALDEVLAAVRPALAMMPGSSIFLVSTPRGAHGTMYELDRRFFGMADPDVLVIHAHWRHWNPTLPESFVQRQHELDPTNAPAEWECVFLTGLVAFLDSALVDSLTRREPRELPRRMATESGTPIAYVGGLDISGGRGDATAAAVAHTEGDRVIVDACRRWPAPHNPKAVAKQVAAFFAEYGLTHATADNYAAELSRVLYGDEGVALVRSEHSRSDTYLRLLPLMTTGRVELPDDPTLRTELLGLERRTARSGKDSVDHAPNGHDDLANAVALAACSASRTDTSAYFTPLVVPSEALEGYAGSVDLPDLSKISFF